MMLKLILILMRMRMLLVHCSYVMSGEMSSACGTYAQWLDDSTRVNAKDLVNLTLCVLSALLARWHFHTHMITDIVAVVVAAVDLSFNEGWEQ